jgi:hypothetical protein
MNLKAALCARKESHLFPTGEQAICDSLTMPHQRQPKGRPNAGSTGKKGDGKLVCALCGRTIKEASGEQPVIYSICATCKKLPHRNPGSAASLN